MEFDDSQWVLGAWWGTIDDCELFEQGWWGTRMDGVSGVWCGRLGWIGEFATPCVGKRGAGMGGMRGNSGISDMEVR